MAGEYAAVKKKVTFDDSVACRTYGTLPSHRRDVENSCEDPPGGQEHRECGSRGYMVSSVVKALSLVFTVAVIGVIASNARVRLSGSRVSTISSAADSKNMARGVRSSELYSASDSTSGSTNQALSSSSSSSSTATAATPTAQSRPNIVFLLIDDLEWNAFGVTDPSYAPISSNMLSLLNDGIYFTRYYGQELCNPARSSLLTGRYPSSIGTQRTSVEIMSEWGLNRSEILLPEVLRTYGNYKTYMLGKWHLGHYRPEYLPTARGFDEFLGYVSGGETYWSKVASPGSYLDFMYADSECYNRQKNENWADYSTLIYEQKIVDAITRHDFSQQPMFLYYASQAVHDPFGDYIITEHIDGLNENLVGDEMQAYIDKTIVGNVRKQLFSALYMLDRVVGRMVETLKEVGQLENTYIIVSSDNGGCYLNGGRDGPLRGSKASLWEGGTKVDSFIYSPLLPDYARGTKYDGISHISDWFPIIVELAGIAYTPSEFNRFDGVSQAKAMLGLEENPRKYVLYNVYTGGQLDGKHIAADVNTNANGAIRNERYKLLHVYTGNDYDRIYADNAPYVDDDSIDSYGDCGVDGASFGNFTYLLFDIDNDVSESNNLYGDPSLADVQEELTSKLEYYAQNAAPFSRIEYDTETTQQIFDFWDNNDGFVQPWRENEDLHTPSPKLCEKATVFHTWDETGNFDGTPLMDA